MQSMLKVFALPLLFAATVAHADYSGYAQVVDVRPHQVAASVPVQNCHKEAVQEGPSLGAQVAGGVLGAVLGSRFGEGHGRDLLTVGGAVAGTVIGGNMSRDGNGVRMVDRCTTEYRQELRAEGYDVTYSYDGRTYTTFMQREPGSTVPVRVTVTPAAY